MFSQTVSTSRLMLELMVRAFFRASPSKVGDACCIGAPREPFLPDISVLTVAHAVNRPRRDDGLNVGDTYIEDAREALGGSSGDPNTLLTWMRRRFSAADERGWIRWHATHLEL